MCASPFVPFPIKGDAHINREGYTYGRVVEEFYSSSGEVEASFVVAAGGEVCALNIPEGYGIFEGTGERHGDFGDEGWDV